MRNGSSGRVTCNSRRCLSGTQPCLARTLGETTTHNDGMDSLIMEQIWAANENRHRFRFVILYCGVHALHRAALLRVAQ